MLEPAQKTIDGMRVLVSPLPARRALKVLHRLGKSVSPSLAKALGSYSGAFTLEQLDMKGVGEALTGFFSDCSSEDLEFFINELLETCLVDDKPLKPILDIQFQAKILTLLRVLLFAIEVNYADFFGGLRGAISAVQATTKTASPLKAS